MSGAVWEITAFTLAVASLATLLVLPLGVWLAFRSIAAGALLAFSRALGEFGATIMVAGAIPGRTRTLAVAIFTLTEAGEDRDAAVLLLVAVAIGFAAVVATNWLTRQTHDR